jgi:hypothetical protein
MISGGAYLMLRLHLFCLRLHATKYEGTGISAPAEVKAKTKLNMIV